MFKDDKKGFSLVELMVSMVIALVIMVGLYKYWIKSITSMTDSVSFAELRQNSSKIYKSIIDDLKFAGYYPFFPNKHPDGTPYYRIIGRADQASSSDPFNYVHFTYFNPDYPNCRDLGVLDSCSVKYNLVSLIKDDILTKDFWDKERDMLVSELSLIGNACIRFIYWDNKLDKPCDDQLNAPCSNMMKIVFAVKPEKLKQKFDITGCRIENIPTYESPCCEIPGVDRSKYIRFEDKILMKNILINN